MCHREWRLGRRSITVDKSVMRQSFVTTPTPPSRSGMKAKVRAKLKMPRPINRAPLGHTRFYCQGALFPWPDKTCNQFPTQFFIISRRNHSKWFGRYIYHISDHALSLKQTMNCPFISDSYPFYCRILFCVLKFSGHKRN